MVQIYLKEAVEKIYKDSRFKDFLLIKNVACQLENKNCISDRKDELVQEMTVKKNKFSNFCTAIEFANETIFDHFLTRFNEMPNYDEKTNLLLDLRCTSNGNSFYKLLNTLLNENYTVQEQRGYASLMLGKLDSKIKFSMVFKFIEENFENAETR
jgi:hypothetical protein